MTASESTSVDNWPFQLTLYSPWMKQHVEDIWKASHDDPIPEDFIAYATGQGFFFRVLLERGEVIGFVIGSPAPDDMYDFRVCTIAVRPSHRRRGHGLRLFTSAVGHAQLLGCTQISAYISEEQTDIREQWRYIVPFLQACELKSVRTVRGLYSKLGTSYDAIVFAKHIHRQGD